VLTSQPQGGGDPVARTRQHDDRVDAGRCPLRGPDDHAGHRHAEDQDENEQTPDDTPQLSPVAPGADVHICDLFPHISP
jgi:hypothetical protein